MPNNILYNDITAVVESDYVVETIVRRIPRGAKTVLTILPPDETNASVADKTEISFYSKGFDPAIDHTSQWFLNGTPIGTPVTWRPMSDPYVFRLASDVISSAVGVTAGTVQLVIDGVMSNSFDLVA